MNMEFRMHQHRAEDDYTYEVGDFSGGSINGFGRREIMVPPGGRDSPGKHTIMAVFRDGRVEGAGLYFHNDSLSCFGFWKDGNLLKPEMFAEGLIPKETSDAEEFERRFVDGKEYRDERGNALTVYDTELAHFISSPEPKPVKSGNVLYSLRNEAYPYFAILVLYDKAYDSYFFRLKLQLDDPSQEEYFDHDWDYHSKLTKTIEIPQGQSEIAKNLYKGQCSLLLIIPASVKTIAGGAIVSTAKKGINVDVQYEGTKQEWEDIATGTEETVTEEDWYGYYYHNSERYSTYTRRIGWIDGPHHLTVHCKDGDIELK